MIPMKKQLVTLFGYLALMASCQQGGQVAETADAALGSNIAWQDNQARFTVITDGVIRMEWSAEGKFTDLRSFVATERAYAAAEYNLEEDGDYVIITTPRMQLRYRKGSGAFTADNLSVTSGSSLSTQFTWHPGDVQKNNLKGTYRTLDGYDGNRYYAWNRRGDGSELPLEDGILATDGWTLLDDSKGLLFDDDPEWPWVKEREDADDSQDYYFMAYGHDYKAALSDYITFAGRVPMPPRYVFGYWWSRYWAYSDAEMRQVVEDFRNYDIPLDVLVVDMDWHWTEEGRGGWTGYTWNDRLFPDPKGFLSFLKQNNLQITLNLHPADGIPAYEDKYAGLASYLGLDPASKQTIPWKSSDKKFIAGYYDKMLRPLEDEGVDFWWFDWQQGLLDDSIKSLSNTWWINYCTYADQHLHRTRRPMLYHRWGGLGNHRYQIGFSGDTYSTWASLKYQAYFNTTSSNVLYGYWSHDIGGHMFVNDGEVLDRELYVRWMQFGAFSPVLRSHSTKDAAMNKEPWVLGKENLDILRSLVHTRYQLAPYIYTMARADYETGLSLCRPLYYDYPESDLAYAESYRNQYMFGDDMLVCPITDPIARGSRTSEISVWLPEGNEWYEWYTGTLLQGGQQCVRHFQMDEYPVYVKAGSIIPANTNAGNLSRNDEAITLKVFPSSADVTTRFQMYEDNGDDCNYASQFATTQFTATRKGNSQTIEMGARTGSYEGMPSSRHFKVELIGVNRPARVVADGKELSFCYDTNLFTATIDLGDLNPAVEHSIEVTYPSSDMNLNDGLTSQIRRIKRTMTAYKYRFAGVNYVEGFGELGSVAEALIYYPEKSDELISAFKAGYANLPHLLDLQQMSAADKAWFLNEIGY